jgi:hypothetical protein
MPPPEDAAQVLRAVRLGWAVAEVRGRNRPDAPPGSRAEIPGPPSRALRLADEQTPLELRLKAQSVLQGLARDLGVDGNADHPSYAEAIVKQARALAEARAGAAGAAAAGDPAALWDALQELIWRFDAHIQDVLAAGSVPVASGYQLGRALAECYWALDPTLETDKSTAAWQFLLGSNRCAAISQLTGDLSAYFPRYGAAAVAGSVQVWKHVAADRAWRQNADRHLYLQIKRWYGLIVVGRDPMTLVRPYQRVRGVLPRVIRYYWGQLALLVLGIAALLALVSTLGSGTGGALVSVVLGIVAAVGVSAGGLSAGRLRQSLNADLAAVAATIAPLKPSAGPRKGPQNVAILRLVRERPTDS